MTTMNFAECQWVCWKVQTQISEAWTSRFVLVESYLFSQSVLIKFIIFLDCAAVFDVTCC